MKRKPLVLGCLVVFVVLLVGGGVTAWLYGRPYIDTMLAARDLGRIQDIEKRVRNTSSYQPPADGILAADQLNRYLSAADHIMLELEGRTEVLRLRYEQLEADGRDLAFSELAGAWSDIIRLVVHAKEAQVAALNSTGFSLAEYDWVRGQVIRSAGLPAYQVNLTAAFTGSSTETALQQLEVPVPAANIDLVTPHVERLEQLAPLAAFGL